jgi:hypothetical protein
MSNRTSAAQAHTAPPAHWGWLGRVWRTLFVHQLRLRRVGGQLVFRFEDTLAQPRNSADSTAALPLDFTRGELTALLDAAPRSRTQLRYLAAVEHGLKHKDAEGLFLFDAQIERLQATARQLNNLLPAQPTPGLAALRTRLGDAMAAHDKRQREIDQSMPRSDLMGDSRIEVAEARTSDFLRATEQWQTQGPSS